MDPTTQLENFAQSVYLMIKNRYYANLSTTNPNSQTWLTQIVDWTNMYIDELETEIDPDGKPIDWIWVRQPAANLGVATYVAGSQTQPTIPWDPNNIWNNLCATDDRFVQILDANGDVLSDWTVVAPDELSNDQRRNDIDMCTVVNNTILFSRPFVAAENSCSIVGDVTLPLPRLAYSIEGGAFTATNVAAFSTIKPLTLLKLGVTKNAILPDIVMGGLNPSYTQKYNDLLTNAINRSQNSSISPTADYDDMGMIHGVGF